MKKKLFTLMAFMLCAVLSTQADETSSTAKTWDFTTITSSDVSSLSTSDWESKSKGAYYQNTNALTTADVSVTQLSKLKITAESKKFRIYTNGDGLNLGYSNGSQATITIEGLKANQIISVSVYNSEQKESRGISATNATDLSGNAFATQAAKNIEYVGKVSADGAVTLDAAGGAIYITKISVSEVISDPTNYTTSISLSNDAGMITYSASVPLDFTKVTNMSAYIATSSDGGDNGGVTMTKVSGFVPAGTGILIKGTKDESANVPLGTSPSALSATNYLVATVDGATVNASTTDVYNYIFGKGANGVGFYNVASGTFTSAKNKAYLKISKKLSTQKDETTSAKFLSLNFEDETNGISTVKSVESTDNVYYTLSGVRVAQPQKGLYILNGKKVIVK